LQEELGWRARRIDYLGEIHLFKYLTSRQFVFLARELIPIPDLPLGEERSLVEVAYSTDDVATHVVLAAVAELGTGVEIAAGTIETLAGRRVGRLQLDLPAGDLEGALTRLHSAGVFAEVTR